ncbi:MAG: SDR family NAD(P)-dependent oxidoreductase [Jatrophihabitans sp.]|uniref:SDR family NAD(P)-dependent oxidoreductase n=1 Tax=Jatrophihabitans sp. TaxID=1932789 RepID=UPI003F7F22A6
MNPLQQLAGIAGKPVGAVSHLLNRPTTSGRHRPFYGLNVIDAIRGGTLEDAVRGRTTMITGASSGIGLATALKIGEAGGEVVLVARGREKLEETAAAVDAAGGKAHVYPCDLSDMDAIGEMAAKVISDLGGVDILINNAGRSIRRSLELSYDRFHDYQRTMTLNYFAPVRLMLALLPGMRERQFGHVINVSSIGVQTRMPRFGAYIASKAALDTLSDSWQAETHSDNVRFSTVHMVLVRTPMIEATTIYQKFPTLSPEEAADVLCETVIHRPRRVSPPFGQVAAFADAISPQIMDAVRNRGYRLFGDSQAARGELAAPTAEQVTREGRLFAEITRGTHW